MSTKECRAHEFSNTNEKRKAALANGIISRGGISIMEYDPNGNRIQRRAYRALMKSKGVKTAHSIKKQGRYHANRQTDV